ncbi:MAG: PqiC family protein, partial [Chromatiales bacterium]|nr:PqiC family protein [Chromatiales bacterium]
RAVGENLGSLLQTERVAIYPADALFPVDLRVVLDVQRFDGSRDGTVTLQARWTLLTGSTNEAIAVEQFSTDKPVGDDSYDALVRAHSAAVEELSRAIAARIRATPTP